MYDKKIEIINSFCLGARHGEGIRKGKKTSKNGHRQWIPTMAFSWLQVPRRQVFQDVRNLLATRLDPKGDIID